MIVKAGATILAGDHAVAGSVGEQPAQQFQALVHRLRGSKGAKVPRPISSHVAHDIDAREILLQADLDVGIALVIFEAHIVARPVSFDQLTFEDEGL